LIVLDQRLVFSRANMESKPTTIITWLNGVHYIFTKLHLSVIARMLFSLEHLIVL